MRGGAQADARTLCFDREGKEQWTPESHQTALYLAFANCQLDVVKFLLEGPDGPCDESSVEAVADLLRDGKLQQLFAVADVEERNLASLSQWMLITAALTRHAAADGGLRPDGPLHRRIVSLLHREALLLTLPAVLEVRIDDGALLLPRARTRTHQCAHTKHDSSQAACGRQNAPSRDEWAALADTPADQAHMHVTAVVLE